MSFLWYWPAGGWDFDRWKRQQRWQPVRSEQSGKHDPLPLVTAGMTRGDWETQAAQWRKLADEMLGHVADEPVTPIPFEWLGESYDRAGGKAPYTLRRVRYRLA